MKIRTTKNREVAETFASSSDEASVNHMFIEGRAVYSYGHHFPIALKLINGIALFNKDGYSNTTSRHKNLVRYALEKEGYKLIEVDTQQLKQAIDNNILSESDLFLSKVQEATQ